MKKYIRLVYLSKITTAGVAFLLSSTFLHAWTISILSPVLPIVSEETLILPDGDDVTIFKGYLDSTGANVTTGSLGSYLFDANAVIINLPEANHEYTANEISVITSLLNSNTRVLIFGENSGWDISNEQLSNIVGGVYTTGEIVNDPQSIINNNFPEITEGVENVILPSPGKISPNGNNGISLSSNDSITLWGENHNFLVFMDINTMSDPIINSADNDKLTQNIISWLTGGNSNIPEPSTYGLIFGLTTLGFITTRRRHN